MCQYPTYVYGFTVKLDDWVRFKETCMRCSHADAMIRIGYDYLVDCPCTRSTDNRALTGVKLFCSKKGLQITSREGKEGYWRDPFYCENENPIVGFSMWEMASQGDKMDDYGAIDIKAKCQGADYGNLEWAKRFYDIDFIGKQLELDRKSPKYTKKPCATGHVVVGVKTKVGNEDETDNAGLVKMTFICAEEPKKN